jgi:hypothetical protein
MELIYCAKPLYNTFMANTPQNLNRTPLFDTPANKLLERKRFLPAEKSDINRMLKNSEKFVRWAAGAGYNAVIFPLAVLATKSAAKKLAGFAAAAARHNIAIEAGGREITSLLSRRHFLLHRDYFRMEGGRRLPDHHFCATSPGAIKLVSGKAEKLLGAVLETGALAGATIEVFHFWTDKDAEALWCACPSCRAFTSREQNRMAANAVADVLARLSGTAKTVAKSQTGVANNVAKIEAGEAVVVFFESRPVSEKDSASIPLRKNALALEEIPVAESYAG